MLNLVTLVIYCYVERKSAWTNYWEILHSINTANLRKVALQFLIKTKNLNLIEFPGGIVHFSPANSMLVGSKKSDTCFSSSTCKNSKLHVNKSKLNPTQSCDNVVTEGSVLKLLHKVTWLSEIYFLKVHKCNNAYNWKYFIYAYMCACMCVCTCACTCMFVSVHMSLYVNMCAILCMHECACVHAWVCLPMCQHANYVYVRGWRHVSVSGCICASGGEYECDASLCMSVRVYICASMCVYMHARVQGKQWWVHESVRAFDCVH